MAKIDQQRAMGLAELDQARRDLREQTNLAKGDRNQILTLTYGDDFGTMDAESILAHSKSLKRKIQSICELQQRIEELQSKLGLDD